MILPSDSRYVGILGGGQLGRLLALDAARLGYDVAIFCPEQDCPASRVAASRTIAEYENRDALRQFAKNCAVVTIEFENVPVSAVAEIEKIGVNVFPDKSALDKSQDRLTEKKFLNSIGIPTASYQVIDSSTDFTKITFAKEGFLKRRRFGYDGKGQICVNRHEELENAWGKLNKQPAILEDRVEFAREISIIAVRSRNGDVVIYDPSENFHKDGILRNATVPANISEGTSRAAREAITVLINELEYVGVLALEFFVLNNGEIVANEFAPRVHNSGHWTPEACNVGQFEQHIRAITGLPLIPPRRYHDVEMSNLLGDSIREHIGVEGYTSYGKRAVKEDRKMGHVVTIK